MFSNLFVRCDCQAEIIPSSSDGHNITQTFWDTHEVMRASHATPGYNCAILLECQTVTGACGDRDHALYNFSSKAHLSRRNVIKVIRRICCGRSRCLADVVAAPPHYGSVTFEGQRMPSPSGNGCDVAQASG